MRAVDLGRDAAVRSVKSPAFGGGLPCRARAEFSGGTRREKREQAAAVTDQRGVDEALLASLQQVAGAVAIVGGLVVVLLALDAEIAGAEIDDLSSRGGLVVEHDERSVDGRLRFIDGVPAQGNGFALFKGGVIEHEDVAGPQMQHRADEVLHAGVNRGQIHAPRRALAGLVPPLGDLA